MGKIFSQEKFIILWQNHHSMITKNIDLIVLEEEKVIRKKLASITPESLVAGTYSYRLNSKLWEQKSSQPEKNDLEPNALVLHYVSGINKVHNTFRKILRNNQTEKAKFPMLKDSYLHLASFPFAYVTAEAYERIRHTYAKEKETDKEIIAVAHCDQVKGIFVSLGNENSLEGTIAHEYGHYLHHTLLPESYKKSSATMKEVIAVFVEEKCGYHTDYVPDGPHYRAEQLLKKLEKKSTFGKNMTLAGQWNFLGSFSHHEYLDELAGILL